MIFIITPRLMKSLPANVALPTDGFVPPNRRELILEGKLEGSGRADAPGHGTNAPPKAANDSLQLK